MRRAGDGRELLRRAAISPERDAFAPRLCRLGASLNASERLGMSRAIASVPRLTTHCLAEWIIYCRRSLSRARSNGADTTNGTAGGEYVIPKERYRARPMTAARRGIMHGRTIAVHTTYRYLIESFLETLFSSIREYRYSLGARQSFEGGSWPTPTTMP